MTKNLLGDASSRERFTLLCALVIVLMLIGARSAPASILTFEVFDPAFDFPPYNDPGVQPFLPGYGYPENERIAGDYGDNVTSTSVTLADGTIYQYAETGEGFTPNVTAHYGPFSIFTGGPSLWREGFGGLNGVLFQNSQHADPLNPIGTDYNILDIVLVADAGFDVVLYDFDLAGWFDQAVRTIDAVTVYDGVPFPFLTPTNVIAPTPIDDVDVPGSGHLHVDFGGTPLQSPVIWLRIDANNLGPDSFNIGIDNIRFGQTPSANPGTLDPEEIDDAFQQGEVPEATALATWLIGGVAALACVGMRRRTA